MMGALVTILAALIAGLLYVSLRRLELSRGKRFFELGRAALDAKAERIGEAFILGGIPVSWRKLVIAVTHELTHAVVRLAVDVIRAVERPLARLSYKLRVSAPKSNGAPVSDFLRTITPEKK